MYLRTPISGTVWKVKKYEGEKVREGEIILTLESVIQGILIRAPFDGVLEKLYIKEGDFVLEDDILVHLE